MRSAYLSMCIFTKLAIALAIAGLVSVQQASGQAAPIKYMPLIVYDMPDNHPDVQAQSADGCASAWTQKRGNVLKDLGPDGKPVRSELCKDRDINNWWRPNKRNKTYCRSLKFQLVDSATNIYATLNDDFFPVDSTPLINGDGNVDMHHKGRNDNLVHNFSFCTELSTKFRYRGGETFDFVGDDDLYIFINGKLALDLGGKNNRATGTIKVDDKAAELGIEVGNLYTFHSFHCERQTGNSVLNMTTSFDFLPPPPPGLHIGNADSALLASGDTLILRPDQQLDFTAVSVSEYLDMENCTEKSGATQNLVEGDWSFGAGSLPRGNRSTLRAADYKEGIYKLLLVYEGGSDFVFVNVQVQPKVQTPVANPSGRAFGPGALAVKLSSATEGAVIHWTTLENAAFSPGVWTLYDPAASVTLEGSAVLRAIAVKEGHINSDILVERYSRTPSRTLSGAYLDEDGDGRIESATIQFDSLFEKPPSDLVILNPFDGKPIPGLSIKPDPAGGKGIHVEFPPLPIGTRPANPAYAKATVKTLPDFVEEGEVTLSDRVGPVLLSAEAVPVSEANARPSLLVRFSEVVTLPSGGGFPFELRRAGTPLPADQISVLTVEPLGDNTYRFVFNSSQPYPVSGDSLRIDPGAGVKDEFDNPSRMAFSVPVTGAAGRFDTDLGMQIVEEVTRGQTLEGVRFPSQVLIHKNGQCLNCPDGWGGIGIDPGSLHTSVPTWAVSTRFPFTYQLAVFSNLGHFVTKANGRLDEAAMRQLNPGGDSIQVYLSVVPKLGNGQTFATGAFILKGELIIQEGKIKGPQGEDLILESSRKGVLSTFGYIRGEHNLSR